MFVVLGYDEDWYTFETFKGVFSSREKAQEAIDNDYFCSIDGERLYKNHSEYEILEINVDEIREE